MRKISITKIFVTKKYVMQKLLKINPFKYGKIVEDDFFTDRVKELAVVKQFLDSENNLILISPRRFGKSSLIRKALVQLTRPYIVIDLMKVLSAEDLAAQLLKGVFRIHPIEKLKHLMAHFRVLPTVSVNPVTEAIDVSFMPATQTSAILEDAFALVEKVSTPEQRMIVVLDEFQEVNNIAKGLDRQLRAIMQTQKGVNYVFMGSQESMMTEIFERKKSPFYHFGQLMHLQKIPREDFYNYISKRLPERQDMTAEQRDAYMDTTVNAILDFTRCHPYYTQQLSSAVYGLMQYSDIFENVVELAISQQVTEHNLDFERLWLNLNMTDRKLMAVLAKQGQSVVDANLRTSTAYSALQRLVKKGYVIKTETFEVEDPFFRQWILTND